MKKKKYLPLYYEWIETMRLPYGFGLCREFYDSERAINDKNLMLFKPDNTPDSYVGGYWGSGLSHPAFGQFTPLRQTIVLFLAAMNNEL